MRLNIDKSEKYFLHNSTLIETGNETINISDENRIFYEVIRVINGKPLFIEEHLERLVKSTQLAGVKCMNPDDLKKGISILVKTIEAAEKNLKITFYCNEKNHQEPELYAYFVESHYPSSIAYETGVKVELLPLKRENPNVKLENPLLRGSADKVICLSQTHEALLVNSEGFITEGSRSNFFAIFGTTIVTPPSNEVLEGITRKVVLKIINMKGFECSERLIHTSEIEEMDGAFITGTSSKVLPISKIGDHTFKTIPETTRKIMKLYDEEVDKNLLKDIY